MRKPLIYKNIASSLAFAGFVGCGGGGGGGTTAGIVDNANNANVSTMAATVTGTAATGAAISSGAVSFKCLSGSPKPSNTSPTGGYTIDVTGVVFPCVGRVQYTDSKGATQRLHTIIRQAGTANITPLTEMLLAYITGGLAADAFDNLNSVQLKSITRESVNSASDALKNHLSLNLGLDVSYWPNDLVSTTLVANVGNQSGDIQDQLLDHLQTAHTAKGVLLSVLTAQVAKLGSNTGGADVYQFPGNVTSAPQPIEKITIGARTVFALKKDGTIFSWGGYLGGELGQGTTAPTYKCAGVCRYVIQYSPVEATVLSSRGAVNPVVDIAVTAGASFALHKDGRLYAVGSNGSGALGVPSITVDAVSSPIQIAGSFAHIVASDTIVMAVGNNKNLYRWGNSSLRNKSNLLLATGNVENVWLGAQSPGGLSDYYVQLTDNTVMAAGTNDDGRYGDGTKQTSASMSIVQFPSKQRLVDIYDRQAVTADGSLYLWGDWSSALTGAPAYFLDPTTNTRIRLVLTPQKVADGYKNLRLKNDGTMFAFNTTEESDGSTTLTVKKIYSNIVKVWPGDGGVAALTSDGSVLINGNDALKAATNKAPDKPLQLDANGFTKSLFSGSYAAPPATQLVSNQGGAAGNGDIDALNFPQSAYGFTCSATGMSKSVQISNGPCAASQKAYSKATSCNEVGNDYSFNNTGKPFYQCLVTNSTGDFKAYYQQYLSYYGG